MGDAAHVVTNGTLFLVIGPSGAGKDTIIDHARSALDGELDVMFVRRIVTRDASAGGEDHASVDAEAFERAEADGRFAFTWRAHGLGYALPLAMDDHLAAGGIAVANGSRGALEGLRKRYAGLVPVLIDVRSDVLATRIAARGRETPEQIEARLRRAERYAMDTAGMAVIDNNGAPEKAGRSFLALIEQKLAELRATA